MTEHTRARGRPRLHPTYQGPPCPVDGTTEYYTQHASPGYCVACKRAYGLAYYAANRDKRTVQQGEYNRERYQTDEEFRLRKLDYNRAHRKTPARRARANELSKQYRERKKQEQQDGAA